MKHMRIFPDREWCGNGIFLHSRDPEALSHIEEGRGTEPAEAGGSDGNSEKRSYAFKQVSIATGTLFCPIMERLAGTVEERLQNVRLKVYPVENDFFGKVSVTGLLTGHDLLRSRKAGILESCALLSKHVPFRNRGFA